MTNAKLQNKYQYTYISQFLTQFCKESVEDRRKK